MRNSTAKREPECKKGGTWNCTANWEVKQVLWDVQTHEGRTETQNSRTEDYKLWKGRSEKNSTVYFLFIYFWLRCVACGILVPQPGMEPGPPAVEARSPNHWTAREFPSTVYFYFFFVSIEQATWDLYLTWIKMHIAYSTWKTESLK